MAILIIITILLLVWLLFFRKKKKEGGSTPAIPLVTPTPDLPVVKPDETVITRHHIRLLERKTYIHGRLFAKYYGELDHIKDLQNLVRERYYDFTLYDAQIGAGTIRRNNAGPCPEFDEEELLPGPIQPNPLPCHISVTGLGGPFRVLLHDVKLANIDLNKHRLLHQQEDDQVFGTLEADITGYMLERFEEEFETTEPVEEVEIREQNPVGAGTIAVVERGGNSYQTELPTGRRKTEQGYEWTEYWHSDRAKTFWGKPAMLATREVGCATVLGWLLLIITGTIFLAAIGPQGIVVVLALAAGALLVVFFSPFLRALLWIGLILMVAMAMLGLAGALRGPVTVHVPAVRDEPAETSRQEAGWANTRDSTVLDSIIVHHRVWRNYDSSQYEGDITVRVSDWKSSAAYKNNMRSSGPLLAVYDGVLAGLSSEDSVRLGGVYHLLDSVRSGARLDSIVFAEAVVSFVQDIPYALVLDGDCNPDGYGDAFTKRYLLSAGAVCDGYQRYGINSPVEFMATLKGDCDTRTLLLFTLLAHYGYDVAILSSELYGHSLLGICLPLGGRVFPYRGRQYVLWETTAPGVRPGLIPAEVSDLHHWRISLVSKK